MQEVWRARGEQDAQEIIKRVVTPEMEHRYYADFFNATLRKLYIEDCNLPELTSELADLKTSPSSYHAFPDAMKAVTTLNKFGVKQAVISNGFHAAPQILAQSGFRDQFEFEIWSYAHGTIKPEQKIYQIALEKAECRPEEAIYIDDREAFVEAAQELGMHAIQIYRKPFGISSRGNKKSFPIIHNLSALEEHFHPKIDQAIKNSSED